MASAVAWSWRSAVHGVALAAPAGIATLSDPSAGLALAVGVLPAAALGLASSRRQRAMALVVGAIAAVAVLLGAVVSGIPALAVAVIFVLCVGVAVIAADHSRRLAAPVMLLGLPLIGVGLSFPSVSAALAAAALLLAGSFYGFVVSLLWPDGVAVARPARPDTTRSAMLVYGIQIGLAGAVAAAVGFALGVDHPGWACAAALLVCRPQHLALVSRGWGRALSVIGGALVACGVAAIAPGTAVLALLLIVVLAVGTGTAGSRWYVFPFFSTFVVLSMLLLEDTATPAHWFIERVGMTLLGVALALAAAAVVPRVARPLLSPGRS
ncbi:FUSC family protein [Microbacterium sp. NPDC087591]|uniref:FUSC family protein n=1 Tax=Microbacterium sp. NPDC087591 TaxID=3364192 RepID=UPI00380ABAF8